MPRTYTRRLSLKLEEWPVADRLAWSAALQSGDVLDPGGTASHWSPATVAWMSNAYGHWLAWLKRNALFDADGAAAQAIQPNLVASYVSDMRAVNASSTVADRVQKLYLVAKVLSPERDWEWLRSVWRRLNSMARPARDKQARLVDASQLFDLGLRLIAKGERIARTSSMDGAVLYRDGLMIAFLAARPLRRKNLAAIKIGEHLVRCGLDYRLQFAARETKSRRALELNLPSKLTPFLDRYISHHRSLLFPRNRNSRQPTIHDPLASSNLWVSVRGTGMGAETMYGCIVGHTRAKFGRSINPHLFRDIVATSVAVDDPKHVRITMNLLGHSKLATTERHYIQARSLEAARRHQSHILGLRRQSLDANLTRSRWSRRRQPDG
jgi:integrase/recombinase XerD